MATCTSCGRKVGFFELNRGVCPSCSQDRERSREKLLSGLSNWPDPALAKEAMLKAEMAEIILTTEASPDISIGRRLEIITAECVLGMNIFHDIASALRDVVGGRSESYQSKLREARKAVLDDLRRQAHALGAHAVVAVDLDYSEISGGGKSMLFLVASGTAVQLRQDVPSEQS